MFHVKHFRKCISPFRLSQLSFDYFLWREFGVSLQFTGLIKLPIGIDDGVGAGIPIVPPSLAPAPASSPLVSRNSIRNFCFLSSSSTAAIQLTSQPRSNHHHHHPPPLSILDQKQWLVVYFGSPSPCVSLLYLSVGVRFKMSFSENIIKMLLLL